jgi:hypothetical protein
MFLPPFFKSLENRRQFTALRAQEVFEPRRVVRIISARNDRVGFQILQSSRQNTRRQARKCGLEILESSRFVEEQITQNQDSPAVADDIEGPSDWAFESVLSGHLGSTVLTLAE